MRFYSSRGALALGLALSMPAFGFAQQAAEKAPPSEQKQASEQRPTSEQRQERREQRTEAAAEARSQSDDGQLTDYFADQLLLANKAEIELSQIAAQKSENKEVKQFAEMLIKDHQKLDEKLKQLAPHAAERFAQNSSRPAGERLVDRLANRLDAARSADRPAGERIADRPAGERVVDRTAQIRTAAREAVTHDTLTKLCMINHKACENHRQMAKQMLESYQGQDFDMAFLGMQIGQHAWLLSELNALDGIGTPEFQQVVGEARQNVEHHLEHAKTLSKKFEDDRRAPRDS